MIYTTRDLVFSSILQRHAPSKWTLEADPTHSLGSQDRYVALHRDPAHGPATAQGLSEISRAHTPTVWGA